MTILAYILSGLALLMSLLLLIQTKNPPGWFVLILKLVPGALSPIWVVLGAIGAVIGWVYQALWTVPLVIIGAGIIIVYVRRCAQDHNGFKIAFVQAGRQDTPEQTKKMAKKLWILYLKMKVSPEPIFERNIPFCTVPSTDRQLFCDIWHLANGHVSSLAFIYYPGGGWVISDKDFGTRPFSRHLDTQGHTVMDMADVAAFRCSKTKTESYSSI